MFPRSCSRKNPCSSVFIRGFSHRSRARTKNLPRISAEKAPADIRRRAAKFRPRKIDRRGNEGRNAFDPNSSQGRNKVTPSARFAPPHGVIFVLHSVRICSRERAVSRRMGRMEKHKDDANLILYRTRDGKAEIALYARDGSVWLTQQQMAELFATSVPNISMHVSNVFAEAELEENSVVKNFLTTASDGN